MAEDLNCEESNYKSDRADSVGSSKSECLSCEFSSFKGGSSGSEAADGATIRVAALTLQICRRRISK